MIDLTGWNWNRSTSIILVCAVHAAMLLLLSFPSEMPMPNGRDPLQVELVPLPPPQRREVKVEPVPKSVKDEGGGSSGATPPRQRAETTSTVSAVAPPASSPLDLATPPVPLPVPLPGIGAGTEAGDGNSSGTGAGDGIGSGSGSGAGTGAEAEARRDIVHKTADWIEKPDFWLRRFYPLGALRQRIAGKVMLMCRISRNNRVSGCRILSESPETYGFGDAALKAAPHFRVRPPMVDGRPHLDDFVVIPLAWCGTRCPS